MANFANNLQLASLVVHEAKIHDVVYDNIGPKPGNDIDVYLHLLIEDLRNDVAPYRACRPWIFFINGILSFLKINGSGMEKEER